MAERAPPGGDRDDQQPDRRLGAIFEDTTVAAADPDRLLHTPRCSRSPETATACAAGSRRLRRARPGERPPRRTQRHPPRPHLRPLR